MKGHIAKRFGDLVREMWTSETRTIAPIKLRWTIGRYRAQFAGFQQQDAQARTHAVFESQSVLVPFSQCLLIS